MAEVNTLVRTAVFRQWLVSGWSVPVFASHQAVLTTGQSVLGGGAAPVLFSLQTFNYCTKYTPLDHLDAELQTPNIPALWGLVIKCMKAS